MMLPAVASLCSLSSVFKLRLQNKLVPLLSRGGYYNNDVILVGVALKRRHVCARGAEYRTLQAMYVYPAAWLAKEEREARS